MDKGEIVLPAGVAATKEIFRLLSSSPESIRLVFKALEDVIENGEWRKKSQVRSMQRERSLITPKSWTRLSFLLGLLRSRLPLPLFMTKNDVSCIVVRSNVQYECAKFSSAAVTCATALHVHHLR
jgi:elongation factor 3